mmetsp:Transcript_13311/g.31514  ORF Transcript_13311/g.31514 Transcript_13311/m.31514 type:complete len:206 (+) Transcript_13311:359-976(+)
MAPNDASACVAAANGPPNGTSGKTRDCIPKPCTWMASAQRSTMAWHGVSGSVSTMPLRTRWWTPQPSRWYLSSWRCPAKVAATQGLAAITSSTSWKFQRRVTPGALLGWRGTCEKTTTRSRCRAASSHCRESHRSCASPTPPLNLTKRMSVPESPLGLFLSSLGFLSSRSRDASLVCGWDGSHPKRLMSYESRTTNRHPACGLKL